MRVRCAMLPRYFVVMMYDPNRFQRVRVELDREGNFGEGHKRFAHLADVDVGVSTTFARKCRGDALKDGAARIGRKLAKADLAGFLGRLVCWTLQKLVGVRDRARLEREAVQH